MGVIGPLRTPGAVSREEEVEAEEVEEEVEGGRKKRILIL